MSDLPFGDDGVTLDIAPADAQTISPSALEQAERGLLDVQIATARRYPRRALSVIKQSIAGMATIDRDTATACFYSLKRDGKAIEGPSVRLAEIATSQYGNLRIATRMVGNDGKTVTAQGICHDLETNVAVSTEAIRRITYKDGRTYSDDMQITTSNAAQSIARRNAVFQVIPRALINSIWPHCKQVAKGEGKTIEQTRKEITDWATKLNISTEQIIAHFADLEGYSPIAAIEDLTLEHILWLRGVATAIRDKETTVEEQFPTVSKKPLFKQKKETAPAPETKPEDAA